MFGIYDTTIVARKLKGSLMALAEGQFVQDRM